jgi:hypothetical protein
LSAIQLASHTITNKSIESANNIGGILALEASKYRDGLIIVMRDLVEDFQSAALREPTWPAIAAGPFVSH